MSSHTRQQLEDWIKTKKVSGLVLDVGGSQNPINNRIALEDATEFTILDLESPHEAKEKPVITWDLNENKPTNDNKGRRLNEGYDYIVCLEVSEYWWNPARAIENLAWLLKQRGTLFISFHFLYPVHNPVNQDYLRYTRAGAVKLLEEAGFEIVEIVPRRASNPSLLGEFHSQEGMRPARGYDFHSEVGVLIEAKKK